MSACINAALEQSDGTIHADGDIATGDVKASRDLLVGESLVKTQLYDLTVGPWQENDHFPEQNKQFSFLGKNLRFQGRSSLVLERFLAAEEPFTMKVLGRVGDDPVHPGTSLGSVKAGMIDGLEDLDPTGLKDILNETIVAGDPLGEEKKAAGATGNPGFAIAFKQIETGQSTAGLL